MVSSPHYRHSVVELCGRTSDSKVNLQWIDLRSARIHNDCRVLRWCWRKFWDYFACVARLVIFCSCFEFPASRLLADNIIIIIWQLLHFGLLCHSWKWVPCSQIEACPLPPLFLYAVFSQSFTQSNLTNLISSSNLIKKSNLLHCILIDPFDSNITSKSTMKLKTSRNRWWWASRWSLCVASSSLGYRR